MGATVAVAGGIHIVKEIGRLPWEEERRTKGQGRRKSGPDRWETLWPGQAINDALSSLLGRQSDPLNLTGTSRAAVLKLALSTCVSSPRRMER